MNNKKLSFHSCHELNPFYSFSSNKKKQHGLLCNFDSDFDFLTFIFILLNLQKRNLFKFIILGCVSGLKTDMETP